MHGMTKLSGLDENLSSHNGSTPGWSGYTSMQPAVGSGNNKGKARDDEDTVYRLFIMPLHSHR